LKNNGPNYITVRFDKYGKIWCVTPENILRILDIDSTKEKESLIHNTLMKGEQNTVKSKCQNLKIWLIFLVSGKMLRYNEERNLIGFKYNNRSIRIFPVFEQINQLNNHREESGPEELSNNSDHVEDREEVEWVSNQNQFRNGKKIDI
jgi:hypothetical protein